MESCWRANEPANALAGGDYSSASAINDAGQVAGAANTGESIIPFVWTPSGGVRRLPLLPGDNCGQPFSINRHGNVVGYSSGPNGVKALLWTAAAGVQDLGTLSGGSYSRARDINDSNEIVGTVKTASGDRAVLWTRADNVRNLGTLPGDTSSKATAINNAGDVVGYSNGPRGTRAFLCTSATGMQNLGVLPGATLAELWTSTTRARWLGLLRALRGNGHLCGHKEGMQDLNDELSNAVGVVFVEAHTINNKDQILVMGMVQSEAGLSDKTHAHQHNVCAPAPEATYLLTPVH